MLPRPALDAEQLQLKDELLREIGPESEFSGALLRKVRESQGVELVDIAAHTKITRGHLEAIEEERLAISRHRLRAGLRHRAREVPAARRRAGAEDLLAPHARERPVSLPVSPGGANGGRWRARAEGEVSP
ncbi:MAG: helix-turn-helix domain-containing protein [Myxococcales bacterium]|nr:helix-turn-helix domain-containing protein [Myxococcales bacterium]